MRDEELLAYMQTPEQFSQDAVSAAQQEIAHRGGIESIERGIAASKLPPEPDRHPLLTAGSDRPRDFIRIIAILAAIPLSAAITFFVLAPLASFVINLMPQQVFANIGGFLNEALPWIFLVIFIWILIPLMNVIDDILRKMLRRG